MPTNKRSMGKSVFIRTAASKLKMLQSVAYEYEQASRNRAAKEHLGKLQKGIRSRTVVFFE